MIFKMNASIHSLFRIQELIHVHGILLFDTEIISTEDTTQSKIYFNDAVMYIYSTPTAGAEYKLRLSDNISDGIQSESWRIRPRVSYEDLELFFTNLLSHIDSTTTGTPVFNNVRVDYNFEVKVMYDS